MRIVHKGLIRRWQWMAQKRGDSRAVLTVDAVGLGGERVLAGGQAQDLDLQRRQERPASAKPEAEEPQRSARNSAFEDLSGQL